MKLAHIIDYNIVRNDDKHAACRTNQRNHNDKMSQSNTTSESYFVVFFFFFGFVFFLFSHRHQDFAFISTSSSFLFAVFLVRINLLKAHIVEYHFTV